MRRRVGVPKRSKRTLEAIDRIISVAMRRKVGVPKRSKRTLEARAQAQAQVQAQAKERKQRLSIPKNAQVIELSDSDGEDGKGGASPSRKGGRSAAFLSGTEDYSEAFLGGRENQGGASPSGKEVQGEPFLCGEEGHGGAFLSWKESPEQGQGGASWSGENGQAGASPTGSFHIRDVSRRFNESRGGISRSEEAVHGGAFLSGEGGHGGSSLLRGGNELGQGGASLSGKKDIGNVSLTSRLTADVVLALQYDPTLGIDVEAPHKNRNEVQESAGAEKPASSRLELDTDNRAAFVTPYITKINEPFTRPVTTQDGKVLIYFHATRSDGKVVDVDNQFMREKYPAMLFDFYECNLRIVPK